MQNALYNLIANKNIYENKTWDKFCLMGIRYGKTDEVIELFRNHTFLRYFPHYKVTNELVLGVLKTNDPKRAVRLVTELGKQTLIKVNEEIKTNLGLLCELVTEEEDKKALERWMQMILKDQEV